jgi:hypothetical protein
VTEQALAPLLLVDAFDALDEIEQQVEAYERRKADERARAAKG